MKQSYPTSILIPENPKSKQESKILILDSLTETEPKKIKKKIPIDLIVFVFFLLLSFLVILFTTFYTELLTFYTWCQQKIQRAITSLNRWQVPNRLLMNALFTPQYQTIYPPHFHFNKKEDSDRLCTENCYQKKFHLYPSKKRENEAWFFPIVPLTWQEQWSLDLALKRRFDDIWRMGIRHIQISLLQQILIWEETRIIKSSGRKRETYIHQHEMTIQSTFKALFDSGNYYIQNLEDKLREMNPSSEEMKEFINQTVPDDSIVEMTSNQTLTYPMTLLDRNQREIKFFQIPNDQEKINRIQILLNWMILYYVPKRYEGYIGKKLYISTRQKYEQRIDDILCQVIIKENIQIMIDYLFYSEISATP